MASAQKKVIIRTFSDDLTWGYLPYGGFMRHQLHNASFDLMGLDGRLSLFNINDIKTISYVKDFNLDDKLDPERMGRRSFPGRPRGDGLWLSLTFRDEDRLEGLASFDIGLIDSLMEDRGLFLTPPLVRANTQRVFVPRAALRSVEVLGFVTAPSKRSPLKPDAKTTDQQTRLFSE